ncbi:MAG: O-antigen ligase family protein [Candidatus Zhuqueibacterota bacterium]
MQQINSLKDITEFLKHAMHTMTTLNEKITTHTRILFFFLFMIFFFMDGHNLSRPSEEKGSVEQEMTKVEDGRLDRRVSLFLLFGFAVYSLARRGLGRVRINNFLGWLSIMFFLWAFYSLAWSEAFGLTARRLMVLVMLFVIGLALAERFSVKTLATWIFAATAGYAALGLVAEIGAGTLAPLNAEYRLAGTLHPNHQGINSALLILSGIFLSDVSPRLRKWAIPAIIMGIALLILTKSRTSLISSLAGMTLYLSVRLSRVQKVAAIFSSVILLLVVLIYFGDTLFPTVQEAALMGREDSTETVQSLTGRVPLWQLCLSYVNKRPIQGYGFGAFWNNKNMAKISASENWVIGESHNAYIELALGLGLVGLLLYLGLLVGGFVFSLLLYFKKNNAEYLFLAALLLFSIIDGSLESAIVFPGLIMQLCFIAFLKLGLIQERRNKELFYI